MVTVRWENGYEGQCNERVAEILIRKGRVKRVVGPREATGETKRRSRPKNETGPSGEEEGTAAMKAQDKNAVK
jgi:hypothetical protein